MPTISALTSFTANTKIKSSEVNANFSAIRTTVNTYAAFVDLAATISGTWTFTAKPTLQAGADVTTGGITITAGGLTVTAGGITVAANGITVTGNSSVTGTLTATTFSGSGASLTNLPAANLTGTLPAISGANLTSLNATNLASGTVDAARLPSSYTSLTFTNGVTISGGAINLTQATSTPNALVFAPGNTYVTSGSGSVPAFGSTAPAAGVSWQWVRCQHNGSTGYVPLLMV